MEGNLLGPTLGKGHFDRDSPLSLYSKLGEQWAGRFMGKLAELSGAEDLLGDETVLKDWLYAEHKYRPNGTDHRYRLQFWLEYENACKLGRAMNMANIYNLTGPEATFHHLVMRDARRVVWMLCRPVAYEAHIREILDTGLSRMKQALEQDPFFNEDGTKKKNPDLKLLALQLKITQMVDLRQHGAPTQKIQELSIKATLGANGEIQEMIEQGDAKALNKRLEELRRRKRLAEGRAPEKEEREAPPSDSPLEEAPQGGDLPIQDAEVVGE